MEPFFVGQFIQPFFSFADDCTHSVWLPCLLSTDDKHSHLLVNDKPNFDCYKTSLHCGSGKHTMTLAFCIFALTGPDIEPYLPTLMETMLSALNNTENLKIKELAVSAIGAIGKTWSCCFWGVTMKLKSTTSCCESLLSATAANELLVPYFTPVIESLKGFLTATTEEMRPLQTQSLGRCFPKCFSIYVFRTETCCLFKQKKSEVEKRRHHWCLLVVGRHTFCFGPYHRQRCVQLSRCRVCSFGPQPDWHHRRPRPAALHVCHSVLSFVSYWVSSVNISLFLLLIYL